MNKDHASLLLGDLRCLRRCAITTRETTNPRRVSNSEKSQEYPYFSHLSSGMRALMIPRAPAPTISATRIAATIIRVRRRRTVEPPGGRGTRCPPFVEASEEEVATLMAWAVPATPTFERASRIGLASAKGFSASATSEGR